MHYKPQPLLPLQKPSSFQKSAGRFKSSGSLPYRRAAFLLVAISSSLLVFNTTHFQPTSLSSSTVPSNPDSSLSATTSLSGNGPHDYEHGREPHLHLYDDPASGDTEDTRDDGDLWDEFEDDMEEELDNLPGALRTPGRQPPVRIPLKAADGVLPAHCPTLFLTTETSYYPPSYTSSSTVPYPSSTNSSSSLPTLLPDQVACKPIPSQLQDYSLAFCVSTQDCSQGFIQVVRDAVVDDSLLRFKVSSNADHDWHFRHVAGPEDFYFLLEGAQKLALGAHLVSSDLLVNMDGDHHIQSFSASNSTDSDSNTTSRKLVYRADFRMTLPGTVQISGWLTYEKFRAIRENRPGVWPQWTHSVLIDPKTKIDLQEQNSTGAATKFTICPDCELDSFLAQARAYREAHFEQCDRMAPVRGSYWEEELALRVYSELDSVNRARGAGAGFVGNNAKKDEDRTTMTNNDKLTRGWRFVPSGCTMTKTLSQPNASSQDPFAPTCDSIASPAAVLRSPHLQKISDTEGGDDYPRRRIFFTGDSQVRTTYNAILNHYRPNDPRHQQFPVHDEYLPGLYTLSDDDDITVMRTAATTIPRKETDTEIELVYKADQFLDVLIASTDEELDRYDTIYLNLGQWPASGPAGGGQWSTARLLERWEAVIERLNQWRQSRSDRLQALSLYSDEDAARKDPTYGSGASSTVIWAGMNAFPMRVDPSIRVKGDWRTNARLGYWDDWIETISQETGGWFRRMNAWQLTFPMLDQVTDRAHFQKTDAIDALKLEALYKLDLCSKMAPDRAYSSPLHTTATMTTPATTTAAVS
ncbi:hypothetical protein BC939DRAFT_448355 [Gamsiella multidivaricata]|uniref:uncharacterized protein n=1 Tax=Gamsiella multidivaricata TaxID=101098 RepID=UPI00221FF98F|nr:uncharacterized protein BC939DRAFT_448355 [Gamsiella multidivaricata]KAG0367914.1 hypothetical protein BGZ54_003043 [Gamsiella multidivaricata]KAI7825255.1 hypothetical protein BC939DRAFT_448355 [Gamsiella multidivaricata]